LLVRVFRLHGPWRYRRSLWLVLFLVAWSAGVWQLRGPIGRTGWIEYGLPFVVAGLIAAIVIVLISPLHRLVTPADRKEFQREQSAVETSLLVFFWSLCALLFAIVVWGYWTR
jgi:hypothetical protein